MNERIKQLAIEAGAILIHDPDRPNEEPLLRLKHLGIEKFAELIVQECARVARNNTPDTEECEYTHLVSEAIKQHFGVE